MKRYRSHPPVIQATLGTSVASQLSWRGLGSSKIGRSLLYHRRKRLYRHRPSGMTDPLSPDLDAWKLVVPEDQRIVVLKEAHSRPQAGHLGVEKTYHRLSLRYYWPGIYADVAKFVRRCDPCQRSKVEQDRPAGFMGQRIVEQPWTVVASDVMGPFPRSKSGHKYVLVFQDLFTKWVEVVPIRTANGPTIKRQFEDLVVSRWGAPEVVHTDKCPTRPVGHAG